MQLDDHLKNLLRELGHAINDTVSDSDRITGAIAGVRAHGYDIVLKLDATIGLAKRDSSSGESSSLTTQEGQPSAPGGWTLRYPESYRLDVRGGPDSVWSGMKGRARRSIRQAQRAGVTVAPFHDPTGRAFSQIPAYRHG